LGFIWDLEFDIWNLKKGLEIMKRMAVIIALLFIGSSSALGATKDIDIQGKKLISNRPPFSMSLPSEFRWVHASAAEHPSENSRTRAAFFVREKKQRVEEMIIVQIAERTNSEAGPMIVPPLKPYDEKRVYAKETVRKGSVEVEYLIQPMVWNPEAPSLDPLVKKGLTIPSSWALQCQFLFQPQPENAVLVRYSRDTGSFGLKVSKDGKNWDKAAIAGNEKKVLEIFRKMASEMAGSLHFQSP
jgi:hypothetical protein